MNIGLMVFLFFCPSILLFLLLLWKGIRVIWAERKSKNAWADNPEEPAEVTSVKLEENQ